MWICFFLCLLLSIIIKFCNYKNRIYKMNAEESYDFLHSFNIFCFYMKLAEKFTHTLLHNIYCRIHNFILNIRVHILYIYFLASQMWIINQINCLYIIFVPQSRLHCRKLSRIILIPVVQHPAVAATRKFAPLLFGARVESGPAN